MATFADTTTQQQPKSGIATRTIHVGGDIYASGLVAADRVPGDVVGRMVGLRANRQHTPLSQGVAAASHIPDLRGSEHQIFIAHDFRNRRCHFGNGSRL